MFTEVQILVAHIRVGVERLRNDDRGYSTEAVVVTALLVSLALAAIAVLAVKAIQKANSINL
ncbi:hypothetical protein SK854_14220 [Lentzea sp. BCCO 10_0061]|uniref:Uncharacterized protein n=1 Tax=Lentzea sokolovensis TaxID=3095429 RepID=A0ABU4UVI5_9PSEU|nr:hypothetical protein [Lentzea sp. BCCO 10_0061]MDX8143280.1 hypothetical protein [Lentzea sp. BCCO 10_0061]